MCGGGLVGCIETFFELLLLLQESTGTAFVETLTYERDDGLARVKLVCPCNAKVKNPGRRKRAGDWTKGWQKEDEEKKKKKNAADLVKRFTET